MNFNDVVRKDLTNLEIIQKIAEYWKKHYYQDSDTTVLDIEEKLVELRKELERAYAADNVPNDSYTITAADSVDTVTGESFIDVYRIFDENKEHYSASYASFKDILHYEILFPSDIAKVDFLGELLWEITFDGFTEDAKFKSRTELENSIQESEDMKQSMDNIKAFIDYFKEKNPSDKRLLLINNYQPLTDSVIEDWSDDFDEIKGGTAEINSWWSNVNVLKQDKKLLEEFLLVFGMEYAIFLKQHLNH